MRIGVIGGGQLGRMMAQAASPLNIQLSFLDPSADACAAPFGTLVQGAYDDALAINQLAASVDRVTFEFESVPAQTVAQIAEHLPVYPSSQALATARDRWLEKSLFQQLGIETAPLADIASQADVDDAVARIGLPAILKTRTLGYDGKGQKVLRESADVKNAFAELGEVPMILEGFVAFDYEVSCIGVRSASGELAFYPLVRNEHRQGMLYRSEPLTDHPLQANAEQAVGEVMDALDYVGVLAFEFFVVGDRLLANEIAPRVHNSGHWTIEGSVCSQFENHVRAVADLPLGDTQTRGPVALYNLIGAMPERSLVMAIAGAHWHDYGKAPRRGRKIGHITVTAETAEQLRQRCDQLEALLRNELPN
ncbi:5-(carboxyamino)imidazole ribonucleotide synthase [Saccharospirillum sp. MSK14-1]|uniref:5-(carboxyamino)imidazole ribonucleotide synthase n=1 Tax=Saccharospirillum sp. MSK14-1 TaxID=1897632 RepID=UPI000D39A824|nr:5-(carboxyamino)imidazole ribonucleotide synthase [Saccharospirillum sp. MSK14-1]PTY37579.1 5-(carboxyamino)imidazole ribonucleotide synthase [Saccharospirillum sp. MSK14-1]